MKLNLKNYLPSIGVVVLGSLLAMSAQPTQAQTYYTNATPGLWSVAGNWTGVNGQPLAGGSSDAAIVFTNVTASGLSYTNDLSSGGAFLLNQLVGPATSLNLYAPDGSALVFTNTGGVLPAITGTGASGMSNYCPITLGANLTLTGGSGSILFYSNITESAQSSLTINRSGPVFLYGANSYSGGTTSSYTQGGNILYVTNGSLGSGPLYLSNTTNSVTLRPTVAGAVNLANPIIGIANTTNVTSTPLILIDQSMNISTFSNLTPVVGGAITNLLRISGLSLGSTVTATITNANYNGSFTVGGSSSLTTVTVAGNFTNTLQVTVSAGGTLNIAGNMAQLGTGSGTGFNLAASNAVGGATLNLLASGTLTNAGTLTANAGAVANMAGTWFPKINPVIKSNAVINISGTANLAGGIYVQLGGTLNVSGIVTNGNTLIVAQDALGGGVVDRGSTLTVSPNGVIYMNNTSLQTQSNALVQVAGQMLGVALRPNGGTIQLSDGTTAGLMSLSGSFVSSLSPTNTFIIGGAPLPGTLMVSNLTVNFPANFILGGTAANANNLNLVMVGAGKTLTLSDTNTYTGATIISSGTLQLGASGSISNSAIISIGNGATFDVSLLGANTFTLQTGQVLSNSAASTGLIKGSLNTGTGTSYISYISGTPAFKVTSGTLTLSAGTGFYVNNTGAALLPGNYLIIATNGGTTAVAGTVPSTVTVNGNSLAGTSTAALSIITNQLYLVVTTNTTTTLAALTGSTYGQAATFTATVNPPPNGGTVQFYTNGTAIGGAVAVNTGTGQADYTTSALNAGSYAITATFSGTANYTSSTTASASTQTVSQASATVTLGSLSQTYDGTAKSATATTTPGGLTVTFTYAGSATAPTNANSYQVIGTVVDANYQGSETNNLVIGQRPITLTAQPNTKVYDGNTSATNVPTLTAGTLAAGEGFATLSEVYADATVNTGKTLIPSATITNSASANVTANYAITPVNNTDGVISSACTSPAIVGGIDPDSLTVTVGDPVVLTLTNVTGSDLAYQWQSNNVDIASATNSSYTNLSVTVADAGNYQVIVTNDCGAITSSVAVLTVNPQAPVIATAPTATLTITYGQTLFDAGLTGGSVTNAAGAAVAGSFAYTSPAATPNAGTTSQSVTFTPDDPINYTTASTTVSVTVDKATPTATVAVNNSPVPYTGLGQAATVGVTASNTPGAVANIVTGGAASQINAGTYVVTADYVPTDTANYNTLSGLSAGNFVIQPLSASVTADAKIKNYGDVNPALTAVEAGTVNGDTLNYTLATDAAQYSSVGVSNITVTLGSNPNYSVLATNSTLTIGAKAASVTADAKIKNYGDVNPALTAVEAGTVNGDTLNYTLATDAAQYSSVGVSNITVTLGSNPNYSVLATNSTLTIGAKAASVTADAKIKNYGDVNPALTAVEAGTVNGDVLNYSLTTDAIQFSSVGTSNITVTLGSNPNYSVLATNSTLTIGAKAASVTANNASKNYGQTVTFAGTEFTSGGLINGDTITSVTLTSVGATNTAGVANYPIVATSALGTGLGNYNLTYVDGTLTVNAATPVFINSPLQLPDGNFELTFTGGDDGVSYQIQASPDLSSPAWSNLATNIATLSGLPSFTDLDATNHAVRFYRTVLP
ncbi:MAG: MBG domain-containing protein [Verrucomicrobiales bacterium]|nr:MBG domain-containing protein [Verrucomicrobiales bacterium]